MRSAKAAATATCVANTGLWWAGGRKPGGGEPRRRADCGSLQGPGDQNSGEAARGRRQPGGQGALRITAPGATTPASPKELAGR